MYISIFSCWEESKDNKKKQLQQQRLYIKLNDTSGICLKPKCFTFELRTLLHTALVNYTFPEVFKCIPTFCLHITKHLNGIS